MLGLSLGMAKPPDKTLTQRAISVLRKYGSNATLYLPGVGAMNGLTAGNYIDSLGTTAGAYDSPLGLALDAAGTVGPELVTNGDFSAGMSGWATGGAGWSSSSGVLIGSTSSTYISQLVGVAGKSYRIECDVLSQTTGSLYVRHGSSYTLLPTQGVGRKSIIVTLASVGVGLGLDASSFTGSIDNISVREVTGNHATQATAASKPTLRRGLVNLLSWSNDFANAAWTKTATIGAPASDPIGGMAATTISVPPGTVVRQNYIPWVASTTGTVALWVRKSASGGANAVRLTTNNSSAWNTGVSQKFALTTEWQLALLSGPLTTTGNTVAVIFGSLDSSTSTDVDCVGNVDIYRAALFQGTVTAAQILSAGGIPVTTTAPASSTAGKPYWEFDGVNDFLQTGITTGNEGWICAGVTPSVAPSPQHRYVANGATSAGSAGVMLAEDATGLVVQLCDGVAIQSINDPYVAGTSTGPRTVDAGWNGSTVFYARNAVEKSTPRTRSPVSSSAIWIGVSPSGVFHLQGSMSAALYFSVLPSAADRAILRKWVGSLQGQTL